MSSEEELFVSVHDALIAYLEYHLKHDDADEAYGEIIDLMIDLTDE